MRTRPLYSYKITIELDLVPDAGIPTMLDYATLCLGRVFADEDALRGIDMHGSIAMTMGLLMKSVIASEQAIGTHDPEKLAAEFYDAFDVPRGEDKQ